ncbi:UPF0175 family protein [Anaerolineales bacterium HSG25]|nr:UPF0175 family protein [Anaerolineales bacterium HSG25]
MNLTTEREQLLELAQILTPADRQWLIEQLSRLNEAEQPSATITLDEAIQRYIANECNSEEAAQLAEVTREQLLETVSERDLFLARYGQHSRAEIEHLNTKLEQAGILANLPDAPKGQLVPKLSLGTSVEEYVHYTTHTTIHEAIGLYLADKCGLGRAAELAGTNRWHIMDILHERDIPVMVYNHHTAEEIDDLAEKMEREGYL